AARRREGGIGARGLRSLAAGGGGHARRRAGARLASFRGGRGDRGDREPPSAPRRPGRARASLPRRRVAPPVAPVPRALARRARGAMTTRARDGDVVLVVDDQPRTAELLARKAPDLVLLASGSDGARHARSWNEVEGVLSRARSTPDAVVLDLRFE